MDCCPERSYTGRVFAISASILPSSLSSLVTSAFDFPLEKCFGLRKEIGEQDRMMLSDRVVADCLEPENPWESVWFPDESADRTNAARWCRALPI